MPKRIEKFDKEIVLRAVDRIANPVIQTITPLGNNVLFEKDLTSLITNDGANIAKLIDSEDEIEDSIIQMVKYGSLATNSVAGDGTSSTVLFTQKLVHMGIDELDNGVKPMNLKKKLEKMRDDIIQTAEALYKRDVTDEDRYKIAFVSSGGNDEIANNVVDIIETSGLDGMIFLNESKTGKTKITKDTGYNLESAMFDPVLGNVSPGKADYQTPSVFITDKKLYHVEECREILETAHKNGIHDIVIVARDFVGEAPSFLISNHMNENVPLNILLIKYQTPDNDFTPLYDLATYLGGEVVSEKRGSLKGNLTAEDYIEAERVYSSGRKTILVTTDPENEDLLKLVEEIRAKKEEDPDDDAVSKRLASLTNGTVNVEIGASTGPELRELIFRYEDAINATRAALRSGFVVGGGVTLFNATRNLDPFAREFGLTSIRQIAENCGVGFKLRSGFFNVKENYGGEKGYNAMTGKYSNLLEDGVIEPFDVFKHSITNAVSIAVAILTTGYFIVNKTKQ